jgi:hypothetical protein
MQGKDVPLKNTKVNIGMVLVRILKALDPFECLSVLNHFSNVANKEPTRRTENEEEIDADAHRKYLQRVSDDLEASLDKVLSRLIIEALRNSGEGSLNNFRLGHKTVQYFYCASKFSLNHNRKE